MRYLVLQDLKNLNVACKRNCLELIKITIEENISRQKSPPFEGGDFFVEKLCLRVKLRTGELAPSVPSFSAAGWESSL